MAGKFHKVLINQVDGRFTINFMGSFPNNKFALRKGQKIYLTEEEWDFVQSNYPHIVGNQVIVEGNEQVEDSTQSPDQEGDEGDQSQFFEQNTNTAKAQIRRMEAEDVSKLIDYANYEELNNKIVDALVERANELGV
jgi:hypothetical protein